MKSGSTFFIVVKNEIPIDNVESIIFTLHGKENVTKTYPQDVAYSGERFFIPLTQEETIQLATERGHSVEVEGQINFKDLSVLKTSREKFFVSSTLSTQIVDGNTPSAYTLQELTLTVEDSIIIAKVNPEEIKKAIEEIDAELTSDYEATKSALEADYQSRTSALEADYVAKKNALDADYIAKKNALEADYVAKKNALEADYTAKKTALDSDYASVKSGLATDYEAYKTEIDGKYASDIGDLRQAMGDTVLEVVDGHLTFTI